MLTQGGLSSCPFCGHTDLIHDAASGRTSCGNPQCGELLDEKDIVAEVQFVQTSSGGVAASGNRVVFGGPGSGGPGKCNEELSLEKGVSKITWIADRLQLSQQTQDAARRIYQLAIQLGFNMGYPTRFIACACLYLVCRRHRSPYLLIDFSDVLQTRVKVLGHVYVQLMRRMIGNSAVGENSMEVPIIDPSMYIERFSRRLELGTNQRRVQETAMRLIQYMHREWICIGRRPNGLCGAALLIAAFYHGFRCSAQEIGEVVRIGENTIKLRLWELRETPLQLMDKKEFEQGNFSALPADGELKSVPPCFARRMRKEKLQRNALMDKEEETASLLELPNGDEQQHAGRKRRTSRGVLLNENANGVTTRAIVPSKGEPQKPEEQVAEKNLVEALMMGQSQDESEAGSAAAEKSDPGALQHAQEKAALLRAIVESDGVGFGGAKSSRLAMPAQSEGASTAADPLDDGDEGGNQETLSDVDDEELDKYVLDDEERQVKSNIWHEVNKDYLEEWYKRGEDTKRKKRHAAADGASDSGRSHTSKKSKKSASSGAGSASSALESAMIGLAKNKVKPHRINIEALEQLFA